MKSFPARIFAVVAVLSLICNALLYLRYTNSRPLVTIGSTVITKKAYQDQLEYTAGETVIKRLVLSALVMQAAHKENVAPTETDVNARIALLERRSPQVLVPYSQDPEKMSLFRQDLMTEIALENLRVKKVHVNAAQVQNYYAAHKADIALPEQVKTTTVVTQNSVDAATATDLLNQKVPTDVLVRQPRLAVVGMNGYNPDLQGLTPALKQQISDALHVMKTGEIRTFRQGEYFLTFRVDKNSGASVPPLAQIKDQVTRLAALEVAPSADAELATLYQQTRPEFHSNEDKFAPFFNTYATMPLTESGNTRKTARIP